MDKLDYSFNDDTASIHTRFKAWFAYNKYQFNQICSFIKVSKPRYVGVLCKLRISLSNKHQTF